MTCSRTMRWITVIGFVAIGLSCLSGCQVPITIARAWEVKNVHVDGRPVLKDLFITLHSQFPGVVDMKLEIAYRDEHGIMSFPERVERVDILKAVFGPCVLGFKSAGKGGFSPPAAHLSCKGITLYENSPKVSISAGVVKCTLVWGKVRHYDFLRVIAVGKGILSRAELRQLMRDNPPKRPPKLPDWLRAKS